jgi:hypothetical protein
MSSKVDRKPTFDQTKKPIEYIRRDTAVHRRKTKQLSHALRDETQRTKKSVSNFIEENKKLFQDVSRLNLKRAEQVRRQFKENRI